MKKTYDIKTITAVMGIVLALITGLSSFAKVYFLIPAEVERQAKEIEELKKKHDVANQTETGIRLSITELKTEIKYLREDTKTILIYMRQKRDDRQ